MKFLNGFKTLIGVLGTVATVLLPKIAPGVVQAVGDAAVNVATGIFGLLGALGIIHKVEKSSDAAKFSGPNGR